MTLTAEQLQDPEVREQALLQVSAERCRRSLAEFIRQSWSQIQPERLLWNWHLDAMSEALEAVAKGQIRKLLMNVPPGCMKSLDTSSFFPAWVWIEQAEKKFLTSTYGKQLSLKNATFHRDLMTSRWYKSRFDTRLSGGSTQAAGLFKTTKGGFRFATSVEGSATGEHADIIICDDLIKARDAEGRAAITMTAIESANEHRFKTLITRRANPETTAFVTIMQRLHEKDPAQRCIDDGDHVCLILPMEYDPARKCTVEVPGFHFEDPRTEKGELLWPERFSAETVQEIRKSLGPISAAAQLDQDPTSAGGAIFKRHWFEKTYPKPPESGHRILVVDCSFKDADSNDPTNIQAWVSEGGRRYLLDEIQGHWDIKRVCSKILLMAGRHKVHTTYVEDKANGSAVVQILQSKIKQGKIRAWNPGRSSKEERASSVAMVVEDDCFYPEGAPFMEDHIKEHVKFPRGRHDDRVDCTSMALLILDASHHAQTIAAYSKI